VTGGAEDTCRAVDTDRIAAHSGLVTLTGFLWRNKCTNVCCSWMQTRFVFPCHSPLISESSSLQIQAYCWQS